MRCDVRSRLDHLRTPPIRLPNNLRQLYFPDREQLKKEKKKRDFKIEYRAFDEAERSASSAFRRGTSERAIIIPRSVTLFSNAEAN